MPFSAKGGFKDTGVDCFSLVLSLISIEPHTTFTDQMELSRNIILFICSTSIGPKILWGSLLGQ